MQHMSRYKILKSIKIMGTPINKIRRIMGMLKTAFMDITLIKIQILMVFKLRCVALLASCTRIQVLVTEQHRSAWTQELAVVLLRTFCNGHGCHGDCCNHYSCHNLLTFLFNLTIFYLNNSLAGAKYLKTKSLLFLMTLQRYGSLAFPASKAALCWQETAFFLI